MSNCKSTNKPIYVISGGKGIAGHTMLQSIIIQFPENKFPIQIFPDIQTEEQIIDLVEKAVKAEAIITHTLVNTPLRHKLIDLCLAENVRQFDFIGNLADYIENELGYKSVNTPGLYRANNAQYYKRIEAIEFTLNHDDGVNPERLKEADIILTGPSRSGKTPLSVYMAMFGWKVANVPLVKGIDPPKELFEVDSRRVFGLSISVNQLVAHREKRLVYLGKFDSSGYIDMKEVRDEIIYTNLIFDKGGFTKINVTHKPVESSANEIFHFISERFNHDEQKSQAPDL